jgi:alpha/beta superfamily hydrolase
MVSKGQFLERATIIPVGDVVMDAVSHRGSLRPIVLVLPPTPQEGGGMDHIVGAELAWAATQAGHPTLRFNYRGVGASQGKVSSGPALVEDAIAALEAAWENAEETPVALATIGGSVHVALEVAKKEPSRVAGIFAVSPPATARSPLAAAAIPLVVVVGELDTRLPRTGLPVEAVSGADATFQRNLPEIGKSAVRFLGRIRHSA